MEKIENHHIVCYDVDDTLVLYDDSAGEVAPDLRITVNEAELVRLKALKAIGYYVIVWSRSGYKWCEWVVKYLELQKYVDLIMEKPLFMIDDQPVESWTKVLLPRKKGESISDNQARR